MDFRDLPVFTAVRSFWGAPEPSFPVCATVFCPRLSPLPLPPSSALLTCAPTQYTLEGCSPSSPSHQSLFLRDSQALWLLHPVLLLRTLNMKAIDQRASAKRKALITEVPRGRLEARTKFNFGNMMKKKDKKRKDTHTHFGNGCQACFQSGGNVIKYEFGRVATRIKIL